MTPRSLHLSLAIITGGTLMLELALIRTLSVALWYPVAYVCLSTAMLGFGAAAVFVALSSRLPQLPVERILTVAGIGFTAATTLGYPMWNALPADPMSLGLEPLQLLWVPCLLILVSLPFAFAGLFVSTAFSRSQGAAASLYAADLFGAAAGVVAYVFAIEPLGGPGAIVLASVAGILAVLIVVDFRVTSRLLLVGVATGLIGASPLVEVTVPLQVTHNKLMGSEQARRLPRGALWTVSSSIEVIPGRDDLSIVIDGGTAVTTAPAGDRRKAIPKPTGLRAIPFALGATESTLVIGSGGGVEVRAALGAGVKRILALEIDGAINQVVTETLAAKIGSIFAYPQVELVTAEARAHLAANDERFQAIIAFHTISNAASSSGAMSLAESYLLTEEAMELLIGRLTDDGVLLMSRPEAQIPRLVATLSSVWNATSPLEQHIAVVTQTTTLPDFIAALVVSRQPLSSEDEEVLRILTTGRIAYLPSGDGDAHRLIRAAARYAQDPAGADVALEEASRGLPYRPATLQPATDDRPFFNLARPWLEIQWRDVERVLSSGDRARARLEDLPVSQIAILLLLLEASLLASVFLLPPWRALRRAGMAMTRISMTAAYFAALGFAFITVEVSLIQRFTRLLGEPGWSLVAVLSVLLLSTGTGSLLLAGRLGLTPRASSLLAVGAAVSVAFVPAWIADTFAGFAFETRLVVTLLSVAPVGLALGTPFSAGLSRLSEPRLIAWAWALNSLFSVGGSIAALILGSSIGFTGTAIIAALFYSVAAVSAPIEPRTPR